MAYKWIISIDRPVNEGVIDFTQLAYRLQEKQRETLFRWLAKEHKAGCALLIRIDDEQSLHIECEYFSPELAPPEPEYDTNLP